MLHSKRTNIKMTGLKWTTIVLVAGTVSVGSGVSATTVITQPLQLVNAATSTATSSIQFSTQKLGYGTNQSGSTVTYQMTHARAGDVFTITVPYFDPTVALDMGSVEKLPANIGTTTIDPDPINKTATITNTFKTAVDGVTSQDFTITAAINYRSSATPIGLYGPNELTITDTLNGQQQHRETLSMLVKPSAKLSPLVRKRPNTSPTEVLTHTKYTYEFKVNEVNGVFDDSSPSDFVNSGTNYGTTITIPAIQGFQLDPELTKQQNGIADQTTITQPGGPGSDIIISVPKGSGGQNYLNIGGYLIAGEFDFDQPAVQTTLKAKAPITMVQTMNDQGATETFTGPAWEETFEANNTPDNQYITVKVHGNSSDAPDSLVVDDDDTNNPEFLAQVIFGNQSANAYDHAIITVEIPDGMDIREFVLPKESIDRDYYLPGTTAYAYEATFTDGTTASDSQGAGATVSLAKPIKQLKIMPNHLAAGASIDTPAKSEAFKKPVGLALRGKLLTNYQNGQPLKDGDQLKIKASLQLTPDITGASDTNTQTIVKPVASAQTYTTQDGKDPGDNGYIKLMGGNFSQTADKIFEPIIYYFLPDVLNVTQIINVGKAKVTQTPTDDGHTLVKVDYTGTGESVDTKNVNSTAEAHFQINKDAMPGDYEINTMIYSPKTALKQTKTVTDPDGHQAVYADVYQNNKVSVIQAAILSESNFVRGDNPIAQTSDTIAKTSKNQPTFDVSINNTNKNPTKDVALIANLPTKGFNGSTFDFRLQGPISLPETYQTDQPINATITYSPTSAVFTEGSKNYQEHTGFVPADQVKDWNEIKAVKIHFDQPIPANATTGRIALPGQIIDQLHAGNQVGFLQTGMYADGSTVSISDGDNLAKLTVTGESTIKAEMRWRDADGDHTKALPEYSKTVQDNQTALKATDFPAQIDPPEGYKFKGVSTEGFEFDQTINQDGTVVYEMESLTPLPETDNIEFPKAGKITGLALGALTSVIMLIGGLGLVRRTKKDRRL